MTELVATLGLGLAGIGALVGAVWTVGKIRSDTQQLTTAISNLCATVDRLDRVVWSIGDRLDDINTRVARLEGRHQLEEEQKLASGGR